jgi:nucleoside-diphosphate-sugar epimerase
VGLADGVEAVAADVATEDGARRACAGAQVVYHCAQPAYTRWAAEFPSLTESIATAAGAVGARLVLADNLYAYGPVDGPMREDTPQQRVGAKGKTRAAMARSLLEAHAAGRVAVAIGRASDYYGPGGRGSTAGATIFVPALKGKKARWLGRLDQPHTLNFLPDVGRGLVTLGERDEALGEVWHLPAAEPLTGQAFLELVFAAAGKPPRIGSVSTPMLCVAGLVSPFVRELVETSYQFQRPFVSDASKFERAFGPFAVTPHPDAVSATVAWFATELSG